MDSGTRISSKEEFPDSSIDMAQNLHPGPFVLLELTSQELCLGFGVRVLSKIYMSLG
jgi:hypothetical protein